MKCLTKQVSWNRPNQFHNVIAHPGGMHIILCCNPHSVRRETNSEEKGKWCRRWLFSRWHRDRRYGGRGKEVLYTLCIIE